MQLGEMAPEPRTGRGRPAVCFVNLPQRYPLTTAKLSAREGRATSNTDRLDMSVDFQPVNIAVMTVSDCVRRMMTGPRPSPRGLPMTAMSWPTARSSQTTCRRSSRSFAGSTTGHRYRHSHRRYRLTGRTARPKRLRRSSKRTPRLRRTVPFLSFAKIGTSTVQSRAMMALLAAPICSRFRDRLPDAATGGRHPSLPARHPPPSCNLPRSCRD